MGASSFFELFSGRKITQICSIVVSAVCEKLCQDKNNVLFFSVLGRMDANRKKHKKIIDRIDTYYILKK